MAYLMVRNGRVVDNVLNALVPHVVGISDQIPANGLRSLSIALKRIIPIVDYPWDAITIDDVSGLPMFHGELLQYVTGISRTFEGHADGTITENVSFTIIVPNPNAQPIAFSGISNEYAPPSTNGEPVFLESALTTQPIAPITNELLDQWSMI